VGGEPYYTAVPIQQEAIQKFLKDLTVQHTKGYKALPADPRFYPIWVFPVEASGDNLWWVSYYHKDTKGNKFLKGHPLGASENRRGWHLYNKDVIETLSRTFGMTIGENRDFM